MFETLVTIRGNVVNDVQLRTNRDGSVAATFRVASTPRRLDRSLGQWVDGPSAFYSVTCWRSLADNVAASVSKGMPVVVHGRLSQRTYEREVGGELVKLFTCDINADTVGHDLGRGVARFERVKSAAVREVEGRVLSEVLPAPESPDRRVA